MGKAKKKERKYCQICGEEHTCYFITSDVLFKRFETPKKKKDSFIKKI
jgi:hypothetical protein